MTGTRLSGWNEWIYLTGVGNSGWLALYWYVWKKAVVFVEMACFIGLDILLALLFGYGLGYADTMCLIKLYPEKQRLLFKLLLNLQGIYCIYCID